MHRFDQKRLRIARCGCTHCRVTRVPDGLVTGQRGQGFGSEDLRKQPDVFVQAGPLSVGHRDARRFLSAVLQGEEPEEGELRGLFAARRGDRDDAGGKQKREKREEPAWLFASTRVRIVSKSFQGGKYYLKKASVIDVLTPRRCVLQL